MIRFKLITTRNFFAIGNQPVSFNLDTGLLSLVCGENGTGKCLRGTTNLDVKFKNKEAEKAFKKFISKN